MGSHVLKPWPFKAFNPRMVCAGNYLVKKSTVHHEIPNYKSDMTINAAF